MPFSEQRRFPRFSLPLIPCLSLGTLPFSKQGRPISPITGYPWNNISYSSAVEPLDNQPGSQETDPSSSLHTTEKFITISYFFHRKKKKKRESFSLYFDIVRRLTGVMPHQMSWCYDMLTLMFNKAHLLQHLEASHIPLRLFYYYYFSLGLHILRFSRKETLEFYSWELSWHEHRVHILLSQVTSVADKSYMGL